MEEATPRVTKTENWTVRGLAILRDNVTLVDVWRDPDDTELLFKHDKSLVIGGIYKVEIIRDGDNIQMITSTKIYLNKKIDTWDSDRTVELVGWETEARGVMSRWEKIAAQKKSKGREARDRNDLAMYRVLEPIRQSYNMARTRSEQEAILAMVIRCITSLTGMD